jgi:hypothetical protein
METPSDFAFGRLKVPRAWILSVRNIKGTKGRPKMARRHSNLHYVKAKTADVFLAVRIKVARDALGATSTTMTCGDGSTHRSEAADIGS